MGIHARAGESARRFADLASGSEGGDHIYSMSRSAVVQALAGTSLPLLGVGPPFANHIFLVSHDGHLSGAATQFANARRPPQSSVRTAPFPSLHLTADREGALVYIVRAARRMLPCAVVKKLDAVFFARVNAIVVCG